VAPDSRTHAYAPGGGAPGPSVPSGPGLGPSAPGPWPWLPRALLPPASRSPARKWVKPDRSKYRHDPRAINTDLAKPPALNFPWLIQRILAWADDFADNPGAHPEVAKALRSRGFKKKKVAFVRSEGRELFVRGLKQLACCLDLKTWTFRTFNKDKEKVPPSLAQLGRALRRGNEERMPHATVDRMIAMFHGAILIWSNQPKELVEDADGSSYHYEGGVALRGPHPGFFQLTGTHDLYLKLRTEQNKEKHQEERAAKREEKRKRLEERQKRLEAQWKKLAKEEARDEGAEHRFNAWAGLLFKIDDRWGSDAADAFQDLEQRLITERPRWSRWHVRFTALRTFLAERRAQGPPN